MENKILVMKKTRFEGFEILYKWPKYIDKIIDMMKSHNIKSVSINGLHYEYLVVEVPANGGDSAASAA